MSKQASKTLIGVFVLGAIALVVAGVVVFGSGKFFKKTLKIVMFFEGSVKGLQVGAPVILRGVQIGQVTDIMVEINSKDFNFLIPVYTEIYPEKIVAIGDSYVYEDKQYLQAMIKRGLRAQLQMRSFVTGQLLINVDFYPNTPIRLVGLEKKYQEIPTIPSSIELLTKKLEELPLNEITTNLNNALTGINKLVNSSDLQADIGSLNQLLKDTDKLVTTLDSQVGPMASNIRSTSDAARAAFVQAKKTLKFDEGPPGQIASSIKETLAAARLTLEETQKAVTRVDQIAAQNANLGYEVGRSLEQITALSRSLRILSDYLERHPEALIKGKNPSEGE